MSGHLGSGAPPPARWRRVDVRRQTQGTTGALRLGDALALFAMNGEALPTTWLPLLDLDAAASADLLLNLWHSQPAAVVNRFRRAALIDTDPALSQVW